MRRSNEGQKRMGRYSAAAIAITGLLAVALVAVLAGCGTETPATSEPGTSATTPTTAATAPKEVKMSLGPFLDNMPWVVAADLSVDKEFGIDLNNTAIASPAVGMRLLVRGEIQGASSCEPCDYTFLKQFPELRDWLITDQYNGFIVVGRKGETETYAEVLASGKTPADARNQILTSFKGKTFDVGQPGLLDTLIKTALKEGGVDPNQVKIQNFADDAKAGLAFRGGAGDFYMGALPQETKLLTEDPGKFVNVGGQDILGAGGLWYSSMVAGQTFMDDKETVMRAIGTWYRTIRYIKEKPELAVPLLGAALNKAAFTKFDDKTIQFFLDNFVTFHTLDEAKKTVFNPSSPLYRGKAMDFYDKANVEQLPTGYNRETYFVSEQLFNEFLTRSDLVKMVNAPLK